MVSCGHGKGFLGSEDQQVAQALPANRSAGSDFVPTEFQPGREKPLSCDVEESQVDPEERHL